MRIAFTFAALLALFACAGDERRVVQGCDHVASAEAVFSGEDADTIETRAFGPNCAHAVGVVVIRAHDGAAVWSWSAPLYPTFGALFAPAQGADVSEETILNFITRWAQLTPSRTSAAPPWPQGAQTPDGGAAPALDRAVYEDVRARDLPMLCHLSSVGMETCVYWESAAAAAVKLVERPAPEASAAPRTD